MQFDLEASKACAEYVPIAHGSQDEQEQRLAGQGLSSPAVGRAVLLDPHTNALNQDPSILT